MIFFFESLDNKQHCATLFIDLSKTFKAFDHAIMKHRVLSIGLLEQSVCWFTKILSNRSECIQAEGIASCSLNVINGVPQGLVLEPLLYQQCLCEQTKCV